MHFNHVRHQPVHREALARETYRRRRAFAETHRAVVFQCRDPSVGCGRNNRTQDAFRNPTTMVVLKQGGRRRTWPRAQATDRQHITFLRATDHDRRYACDVHEITLQHAQGDACSNARIDSIPTCFEDGKCRMCGAVMARHRHVAGSHQARAQAFNSANGQALSYRVAWHRASPNFCTTAQSAIGEFRATHALATTSITSR